MDTSEKSKRWWRKKRWWAAGAFWLAASYAVAYGPLVYAVQRGWLPQSIAAPLHFPAGLAIRAGLGDTIAPYARWWTVRAVRDAGGSAEEMPDGSILVFPAPTAEARAALNRARAAAHPLGQ